MLWYKSWLDTRWRFLIPLAILSINAWGLVIEYAPVANVFTSIRVESTGSGVLGRAIQEALDAERTYRGYIWYQWFRQNLMQIGTLCAALLGSGNLLSGPQAARCSRFPCLRPETAGWPCVRRWAWGSRSRSRSFPRSCSL